MTSGRDADYAPLSQWILGLVDSGRFRSIRALALQAKLSQNTLHLVLERGRAEPETLLRLAEVAGVRPIDLFVKAGWLSESDIEGSSEPALREDELDLVDMYRRSPEPLRRFIMDGLSSVVKPRQPAETPRHDPSPPSTPAGDGLPGPG